MELGPENQNWRYAVSSPYTDSEGKRRVVYGTARGWGTTLIIEGKRVLKTNEMAQDEAAHDHDNLKNEHEGRGFCDFPTGPKAKFFNEYNYPDDINKIRRHRWQVHLVRDLPSST
jgi:hypothetical protein